MKKTKRMISVLVSLAMILVMMAVPVYAARTATVTVGSEEAVPGDKISLPVTIKDNPGFTNYEWNIEYDTTSLTLDSITSDMYVTANPNKGGKGFVTYARATAVEGDKTLFTLEFTVKDDAPTGTVEVKIVSDKFNNSDNVNNEPVPVAVDYVAGTVKVAGTGETTPGTGETTPGTGETTPGTGETTPGTGETTPGTGETTPGTGETTPGTGETTPGTGETTPGTGETTPGTGETTPGTGETTPGTGETTPGTGETPEDNPETVKEGWQQYDSGEWYYYQDDELVTGWLKDGNTWYYLDPETGAMATGWQYVNGVWYYLKDWGGMATGWQYINGVWYYLYSWGGMATGWQYINGVWYYLYSWGGMAEGWVLDNGVWYYLDPETGAMQTGWKWLSNKWYYLYTWGGMAYNTAIDGYYLGADGVMR